MHYLLYATDGTRHLVPSDTMRVGEAPIANGPETVTKVYGTGFIPHFDAVASFDQIQQLIARFGYREDGVFSIEDLERDEARLSAATMKVPAPELRSVWPEGSAPCATTIHRDPPWSPSHGPRAILLGLDHAKVNAAWRKMWEDITVAEAMPADVITEFEGKPHINCGIEISALHQLMEFIRMQGRPKGGSCTGPGDCASYPAVTE